MIGKSTFRSASTADQSQYAVASVPPSAGASVYL
jgi:hypothetical protein